MNKKLLMVVVIGWATSTAKKLEEKYSAKELKVPDSPYTTPPESFMKYTMMSAMFC
jgi:hypothetical protein